MKNVTPLRLEELTAEQKLGMVMMGSGNKWLNPSLPYTLELIKKRALGTVWVVPSADFAHREVIKQIKEAADYPILICCDLESGYPGLEIGKQYALACNDNLEYTYKFARSVGALARRDGYNVICSPILERVDTSITKLLGIYRRFSDTKEGVVAQAAAYIKGFHDAGIYSIAKHYPSIISAFDSHMQEGFCNLTEEELVSNNLYPYIKLIEMGLLDGVMTGHSLVPDVDKEYPASLSKKLTDILRKHGFEGVFMTDSLEMMGIRSRFGSERFKLALLGGNEIGLSWGNMVKESFESLNEAYAKGEIPDDFLNEAVARVLKVQESTMREPAHTIDDEDYEISHIINRNSIVSVCDGDLPASISRDGHHLFVVMTEQAENIFEGEDNDVVDWYHPRQIVPKIRELFPNSDITSIPHFPDRMPISNLLHDILKYDDVVFISYVSSKPYQGYDAFTARILSLLSAIKSAGKMEAFIYYGNPFVLESVPHMKRIIAAPPESPEAVLYSLEALAGNFVPVGKFPYDVKLN